MVKKVERKLKSKKRALIRALFFGKVLVPPDTNQNCMFVFTIHPDLGVITYRTDGNKVVGLVKRRGRCWWSWKDRREDGSGMCWNLEFIDGEESLLSPKEVESVIGMPLLAYDWADLWTERNEYRKVC